MLKAIAHLATVRGLNVMGILEKPVTVYSLKTILEELLVLFAERYRVRIVQVYDVGRG